MAVPGDPIAASGTVPHVTRNDMRCCERLWTNVTLSSSEPATQQTPVGYPKGSLSTANLVGSGRGQAHFVMLALLAE
jgi:hypothetical protein